MTSQGAPVVRLRADRLERLTAQLAAPGPHLEPVLDVGRATNGDLLLVVPEPAARLADLLAVPGFPSAGEAVTVLVPLAEALLRLHGAGVAHAGVGAAAVLLDADGAPYWVGPGAPVLRARAGEEAFRAAAAADVAAFRGLAAVLLAGAGVRPVEGRGLEEIVAALWAAAEPEPVRLHPAPPAPMPFGTPSRLLPAAAAEEEPRPDVPGALRRLVAPLRAVRLRVWAAAVAAALLLAVVPVLLPADRPAARPLTTAGPTATAPASTAAAAPSRRTGRTSAPPAPGASASPGPAAIVRALLAARADCLAAASERCLQRVDAAGSPVLHADVAAVRAGVEAVRADVGGLRIRSTGGSAVLADAGGATVLAVREPGGWRLRDVLAPRP